MPHHWILGARTTARLLALLRGRVRSHRAVDGAVRRAGCDRSNPRERLASPEPGTGTDDGGCFVALTAPGFHTRPPDTHKRQIAALPKLFLHSPNFLCPHNFRPSLLRAPFANSSHYS